MEEFKEEKRMIGEELDVEISDFEESLAKFKKLKERLNRATTVKEIAKIGEELDFILMDYM